MKKKYPTVEKAKNDLKSPKNKCDHAKTTRNRKCKKSCKISVGILFRNYLLHLFLLTNQLNARSVHKIIKFIIWNSRSHTLPRKQKNKPDGASRQVKMAYLPYCAGAESATPAIALESGHREQRLSRQLLQMLLHFCIELKAVTARFSVCVIGLFNAHASRLRMKAVSELIWGV